MAHETFDDLADIYETTIDWTRRLGNEEAFYRELFDRVGARIVLDAACGTGHHAAMFCSWGMRVEGADISEAMIRRCRQRYGESGDLRWVVRGFDEPIAPPEGF
jgi:ubiquinone/menaquinone biosynthesis C-methylase UbiE